MHRIALAITPEISGNLHAFRGAAMGTVASELGTDQDRCTTALTEHHPAVSPTTFGRPVEVSEARGKPPK